MSSDKKILEMVKAIPVLTNKERYLGKIQEDLVEITQESESAKYLESRSIKFETYKGIENLKEIRGLEYYEHNKKKVSKVALIGVVPKKIEQKFPSVQRIFLDRNKDGAFVKDKKNSGPFSGQCIPLYKKGESLEKVVLAEGLENTLSARQITGLPAFCGISVSNLSKVKFPDEVREVHIFSDNDRSKIGQLGAFKAQKNLINLAIKAYVIIPPRIRPDKKGIDWNDIVAEKGDKEALDHYTDILEEQKELFKVGSGRGCSAFEVSTILHGILEKYHPGKSGLFHKDGTWFKKNEDLNSFKIISNEELKTTMVNLMQNENVFPEKITESFIKSVLLNLKGKLDGKDINFPSIKGTDLDIKNTLFVKGSELDISKSHIEKIKGLEFENIFTRYRVPVEYKEHSKSLVWDKFLLDVSQGDSQIVDLLQEFFGFCLTGHYDFHKFLYIHGRGRNGKGVIATVLGCLIGKGFISTLSIEDLSKRFRVSNLANSLVNITNEGTFKKALNEALFKDLVAGGTVTVERKYDLPFNMKNQAKFLILSNEHLEIKDSSDAGWARALVMPLKFQILKTEDQNHNLSDSEWWDQSGELPGILIWAIKGRQRLYKNKSFTEIDSAKNFLKECKEKSNITKAYILENFEEGEGEWISTMEMFEKYKIYCSDANYKPVHLGRFTEELQAAFLNIESKIRGTRRKRGWCGLRSKGDQ